MSSERIEHIEHGDCGQQQHVGNHQAAEATQRSVRRKRNLVLQELSLAVGTVQRINNVLGDIDALLTAPEDDEEKEEEGGDHDGAQRMVVDRGEEGPRSHVGVAAANSARAASAASSAFARAPLAGSDAATTTHPRKRARDVAAAAAADDTRNMIQGAHARSILVKQRLLLEELERWKDS
jgi:hypothetical protein